MDTCTYLYLYNKYVQSEAPVLEFPRRKKSENTGATEANPRERR